MKLKDRCALVTGASKGIGRAIALGLAREGAHVMVNFNSDATSRAAIHGLTRQLAVELAPFRIRVNTFAPGPTQVDRNLRDDPDYDRSWGSMTPMNRTATPEEMVGPAVFLASDDSSYMTGQVFFVDGGWTVQGKIPLANMNQAMAKHR